MRLRYYILPVILWLFLIRTPASAKAPELMILSPQDGEQIPGHSITVRFQLNGLKLVAPDAVSSATTDIASTDSSVEGHLRLTLDLQPVVIWAQDAPFIFNDVPAGEHQLRIEVVDNDNASPSPLVVHQLHVMMLGTKTASSAPPTQYIREMPNTGINLKNLLTVGNIVLLVALELVSIGIYLRRVPTILKRVKTRKERDVTGS